MRGPLPFFQPRFSEAELRKAQKVARRGQAPHAQVRRARLALELARHPVGSSREIGQRLGLHAQTVRKWRKRWALEGFSLEDKPRSGRPKSFSPSRRRAGEGDCV
jgi:predicted ArsR family transcriptional regulator